MMTEWFLLVGIVVACIAGLAALSRPRTISEEEYEQMQGKGAPIGSALLEVQSILEPGRVEHLRRQKTEVRAAEEPDAGPPQPGGGTRPGPP